MFRKFMVAVAIGAAMLLSGCGNKVEVPSATVAKVMTKDGYKPGVVATSKFRLDPCMWYCDEIVFLNVADIPVKEPMELFMPKDKLNMRFTLQATLSVRENSYDDLFARIQPVSYEGNRWIPGDKVYQTYAQQIILAEARELLSDYSINEIASNLQQVNEALSKKLTKSIDTKTPYSVRYIGLSNLQYPKIITNAQENAAERTEKIRQEEAQVELSKVVQGRELEEARLKRKVDVEKAEAEAQVNLIISRSMTPQYVQYQQLSALQALAISPNKVFVPLGMLDSVAAQMQMGR